MAGTLRTFPCTKTETGTTDAFCRDTGGGGDYDSDDE